jgi:hypothetical protein
MKTKKPKPGSPLPGFRETPEEVAERELAQASETDGGKPNGKIKERFQLSFDLNEDGSPDLAAMRESTREKVKKFFGDPKIAALFGAKAPTPEVQVFHPSMVAGLYAMLGSIEASVLPMAFSELKPEVAKTVFTYSPAEVAALEGPTVRVLNKYAADWMIKYQDEIALGTILISLTVQKVQIAITLSKRGQAEVIEIPKKQDGDTPIPN